MHRCLKISNWICYWIQHVITKGFYCCSCLLNLPICFTYLFLYMDSNCFFDLFQWAECMQIGRDLLRLLQNVARIPEFEKLWRDIFLNPTALCPNFAGIMQLMQIRTSRRYLISRLTPDMEGKLIFLISKVIFSFTLLSII